MNDDRLSWLLEDAVSEVEPADRLPEIRSRARPSRRRWVYAGGALVAAAATVAAVAVVDRDAPDRALDPVVQPTASPSPEPSEQVEAVLPLLYWVGDAPRGDLLFSERTFLNLGYGETLLHAAVRTVIEGSPIDPDYRSAWRDVQLVSARDTGSTVRVTTTMDADKIPFEAALQVANTVYALLGQRVEIEFASADQGFPTVYRFGVLQSDDLVVLSPVQVEYPIEGQEVSGTFTASGLANSYEATVPWRVEDVEGAVVLEGFATAEGWMDRLYPWETDVDVSGLEPGTYTFVASTADPSGGAEGAGPTTDTRTVYVR